ncbi:MAG: type II secretion system protein, partial [Rhodanobacteraceae bacterium]
MTSGDSGFGIGDSVEQGDLLPRFSDSRIPIPQSRQQGFTLIELMAVILLLAIALTAVTFSFSKSLH